MFAELSDGEWRPVTAARFAGRAAAIAAGLVAAGIAPGDRVGLLAPASLDWLACDFAIWAAGAVTVPVYETSSVDQVRWELDDSGAVAAFAGSARSAGTIRRARPAKLETVWRMDDGGLDALARSGQDSDGAAAEVSRRRAALTAGTLATIVYTSGSTGQPKGCAVSHGNLAGAVRAITAVPGLPERVLAEDAAALFFLPLSHILARVVALCLVHAGRRSGYLPGTGRLARELGAFRPTILLAVPRVLEKVIIAARERAEESGHARLFGAAEATAIAWSRADPAERRPQGPRRHRGPWLRVRHAAFGRLVYPRLRAALGGRVAWIISGGAPLSEDAAHFLRGAGLPVLEGWGLTETTGGITLNQPGRQRIGSVGLPLPGCAVRAAADGELEAQGPTVFQGYWHDPAATADTFRDGWLRTGDLGRTDDDGFVYVTGRKKDLIVTAGGKNVAPGPIEDRVREHWLIAECVLVGDRRPYITALVTLDQDAFARWKQRTGKPADATVASLRDDPSLHAIAAEAIDRANEPLSQAESVKRFAILPDAFETGAELTPTQKVRRGYVLGKYAAEVDALYARNRR